MHCDVAQYPVEDAQIKQRRAIDNSWYNNNISLKLVQGLGRCVRAVDDYACNYLIDPGIISFIFSRGSEFIPEYIKKALRPINERLLNG